MAESYFADTRFFEVDDTPKETMPASMTSIGKGTVKNIILCQRKVCPHISSRRKKTNWGAHPFLPSRQM